MKKQGGERKKSLLIPSRKKEASAFRRRKKRGLLLCTNAKGGRKSRAGPRFIPGFFFRKERKGEESLKAED